MKRNRILFLTYNATNKGTFFRAFNIAKQLSRSGFNIDLITTSPTNKFKITKFKKDNVSIIEMPDLLNGTLRSGWDMWNSINRIFWLKSKKYDLVHAFESRPTVLIPLLFLHMKNKTPVIMDWADLFGNGGSVEQRKNLLIRILLRPIETFFENIYRTRNEGNTIICNYLLNRAIQIGIPEQKLLLFPNGCDTESIKQIPQMLARKKANIPENEILIGHIGTIFYEDAILAIKAFDYIHEKLSNTKLMIIGYCPINFKKISSYPESIYISRSINNSEDISYNLSCCDIGWLPLGDNLANKGRLPLKFFDYLSAGLPVVSTEVGDIPDYIRNYNIGIVSNPNWKDFAEKTMLLINNLSLRKNFSKNALEIASKELNWQNIIGKLIDFYDQILEKND